MTSRLYHGRVCFNDGRPAPGSVFMIERGTAPTPEIAMRAGPDGRFALSLPDGVFDAVVRWGEGTVARARLDTSTLPSEFRLTLETTGRTNLEEEDMPNGSISNTAPGSARPTLGSVSNDAPEIEAAAVALVVDTVAGNDGKAEDPGLSARDLLVRGREPFKRQRRPAGPGFESILGVDERTRILDTEGAPWRMICSLDIRSPNGVFIGSGWFAGPRTVITAGHCVNETQMGGWAEEIIVRAGRSGTKVPFTALKATRFSTTDRWFNERNPDFDYAAIHLEDDAATQAVTAVTGWFSTAVLTDSGLRDQRVNVAGYPGDKGGLNEQGAQMWFHAKQIVQVTSHRILYDVDTMGGQSGAPAWLETEDGPRVVGIHAYGVGGSLAGVQANSAPRITVEVLDRIREWLKA